MTEKRWLKAELHAHCSLDPMDYKLCRQSPTELIDEAVRLSYEVLAITCHNLDVWTEELSAYASRRGLCLIPGMEVSVEGVCHTLVYNFHAAADELNTLEKIRAHCRVDTLVIAPHPFFPGDVCLRERLPSHIDLFDAIEISGFYAPGLDFNRRARRLAAQHDKPLVGNGDVHLLWQLGRTFTWIHAEKDVASVLAAIRKGHVRVETRPYSYADVARFWATALYHDALPVHPTPTGALPQLSAPAPHSIGT